jgi:hypothetical protein
MQKLLVSTEFEKGLDHESYKTPLVYRSTDSSYTSDATLYEHQINVAIKFSVT